MLFVRAALCRLTGAYEDGREHAAVKSQNNRAAESTAQK